ncbi:MAG TPA: N-acetylmuramoyl-L-alanine amidase [Anaerolineae bacterium]|jgi:N-acetylmuramoyl-L-alanine amidase
MKKRSDRQDDGVQREVLRRAQASGKKQAATSARRATSGNQSRGKFRPDPPQHNDVSVSVPGNIRRAIVYGIIAIGCALIIFAIVSNLFDEHHLGLPFLSSAPFIEQATATIPVARRVGIVSGHRGNDSGSVCQDGLTEARINFDTAQRVATMLRSQGYVVDILDEFDPRLKGYQAALLLSIHADSCTYINDLATGFKVARVFDSKIPQEADRLVGCITSRYMKSTGLRFHQNTVTTDMTRYHAFNEIDEHTPGAIIETGFLYLDRQLLTQRADLVAQGIYTGLLCFLNNES